MREKSINLDKFLPYRLSVASNLVSAVIAGSYRDLFGLRIPEWRLLAVLAQTQGTNQQDIGKRTCMDKVAVSRAAQAMQARGLIERLPNDNDGRSHILVLTADGEELYRQVVPHALELEREIFASLTPDEVAGLHLMLDKIMMAAHRVIDPHSAKLVPQPQRKG